MSIEQVTTLGDTGEPFKKGLAIIVGNEPDGILVHVAYVLGLNKNGTYFHYLDAIGEEIVNCDDNDIIYLIGHGSSKNHTIDGQDMEYIAEKLYNAGYRGKQILYITSCYAADTSNGESICELLHEQLRNKGASIQNVQSDFDGLSITVDSHGIKAWNVKINKMHYFLKHCEQTLFLNCNKYQEVKRLETKDSNKINNFKMWLIKDFGGDIVDEYFGPWWWIVHIYFGAMAGEVFIIWFIAYNYGTIQTWDKKIYVICVALALGLGMIEFILEKICDNYWIQKILLALIGGSIAVLTICGISTAVKASAYCENITLQRIALNISLLSLIVQSLYCAIPWDRVIKPCLRVIKERVNNIKKHLGI